MKPVIGITMSREKKDPGYFIKQHYGYIASVELAGGIPVLIPLSDNAAWLREFVEAVHMKGLILAGGEDVHPLRYGEDPGLNVHYVDPLRDSTEFIMFEIAREKKLPVMGICRGLQLINIALGGTLYQHLDTDLKGSIGHHPQQFERHGFVHEVRIEPGNLLSPIFPGGKTRVNSVHHQGIKDLAADLRPTVRSSDGLIEGVEYKDPGDHFLFAVQWHPEATSHMYRESLALFQLLLEQAQK
ncbi:MAG: gamma-glutamyl-gamma-aminobutyrate hydrolase family protein [Fusobacteriaceae bacterium]|jgi:putative glutamine amidotransferase|nr:gamma-glutamyl-gamma-aminobutyrate hydrolase family protein [Fusobacteriaceae bacterium]